MQHTRNGARRAWHLWLVAIVMFALYSDFRLPRSVGDAGR